MLWRSSILFRSGIFGLSAHLVAYAGDQGLDEGTGVFLIPMIGATNLFGRVILTATSDRLGRCNPLVTMHIEMGLGFLL